MVGACNGHPLHTRQLKTKSPAAGFPCVAHHRGRTHGGAITKPRRTPKRPTGPEQRRGDGSVSLCFPACNEKRRCYTKTAPGSLTRSVKRGDAGLDAARRVRLVRGEEQGNVKAGHAGRVRRSGRRPATHRSRQDLGGQGCPHGAAERGCIAHPDRAITFCATHRLVKDRNWPARTTQGLSAVRHCGTIDKHLARPPMQPGRTRS